MDLAGVDLNLLKAFDALIAEGSVTGAARRVGLSQPAMSNALSRLRLTFDDELFLRTPTGMQPTVRATALATPIREALERISAALSLGRPFEPATAVRDVPLGLSEHAESLLLPRLLARLQQEAPGLMLRVRPLDRLSAQSLLDAGGVDLAVGVLPDMPAHLTRLLVRRDGFSCLLRADHPAARGLDLETFLGLPHLLVSQTGEASGMLDRALDRLGRARRVAVVVPHYLTVPELLATGDLVATLPAPIAARLADGRSLARLPVPLALPDMRLSMCWHRRAAEDAAHVWLRRLVAGLLRQPKA